MRSMPFERLPEPEDGDALEVALAHAHLCRTCLGAKSGLAGSALDDVVERLRRTATLVLTLAPCDGCGRDTLRYRLGEAPAPPPA